MSYLANKVVLITGASSGIGAYLARELAGRGARVGLVARRAERLQELTAELRGPGLEVAWAEADVQDGERLHQALDSLAHRLGAADVVVANAGFGRPEAPGKFQPGRALRLYDVNTLGVLRTIDWALPRFLERGAGHIVGISSVASYFGMPHYAAYCGSKAAVRVHLQSLRLSLRKHGITVSTICPGFVKSELTDKNPFHMPFLWETDRAARRIANAMEKRRAEVVFPWQMKLVVAVMTRLPRAMTERLLG